MQPVHFLYLAIVAFTAWMVVDVNRRQAGSFWFWLVLLVPVVGPGAYFLLVKVQDCLGLRARVSLEELRHEALQTPTLARDLALAEALIDHAEHAEAIPCLQSALRREPDHCQVLYWLAVCHIELGHPKEALPLLEIILARDRCWSEYRAWQLYIAAKAQAGDGQGALVSCRELVRLEPTLPFQCLLAERLLVEGMPEEAHQALDEALETYRFSPAPIRRRNRRWARHARRLQKRALASQRS